MKIIKKIDKIVRKNNSLVCVGLDSDVDKLPVHLRRAKFPQFDFNRAIIDATAHLVCAYKPNSAFYEARGEEGIKELKMTCDYLNQKYSEIVIILDAKRADIGSTNEGYVKYAFEYLNVDALTIHPYLGHEAIKPFLEREDKGAIILCRTSNPGAGEFQDLKIKNKALYQIIAERVVNYWDKNNNCLLVVGATYPKELSQIRKIAPHMYFLVPGVGAQGGNVQKTIEAGLDGSRAGLIINAARSIIFASDQTDFADKAKEETLKLKNEINLYRYAKTASRHH